MRRNATRMLALAGLFALVSCGGSKGKGGTTPGGGATPTSFFEAYKKASLAGDVDGVWAMMTKATQDKQLEQLDKMRTMDGIGEMLGVSAEQLAAMSTDDLRRQFMTKQLAETHDKVAGTVIDHVEQQGPDRAIVHTTDAAGKASRGVLVREGGVWKLDLLASEALEDGTDKISDKRPVG
ncbi:MAG: hypothetical protein IT370_15285 [Deltaproteobacteria bacterium]|nr:hypothetical protein [Deltaproteobacteria bacterium]